MYICNCIAILHIFPLDYSARLLNYPPCINHDYFIDHSIATLVLHAHWQPPPTNTESGGILFWAETSIGFTPTWQRGRIAKNPKPKNHPFCTPLQDLQIVLQAEGDEGTAALRMPTSRTGPLPSPGLIHDWELDQETQPYLAQWLVKGLWLPPAKALPILLRLPELDIENVQFVLGADAIFWSQAAALTLETLATHKLVPVIVPADGAGSVFHA